MWDVAKTPGVAISLGAPVYWDQTTKLANNASGVAIGIAAAAASSGASIVTVKLGGQSSGGSPVAITGTGTVGSVLTAALQSGWSATGYQWTRGGVNIGGATASTYTVQVADEGLSISCRVTGLSHAATGISIATGSAPVAPTFVSSQISANGTTLTITMSTALDVVSIPANNIALMGTDSGTVVPNAGTVSGNTITFTGLTPLLYQGDAGITVAYSGTAIKNSVSPYPAAANFAGQPVTNNSTQTTAAAPTFVSSQISANGTTLTLTMSTALQSVSIPANTITLSGTASAMTIPNSGTVSGGTVTFTGLSPTIYQNDTGITIAYAGTAIANATAPNPATANFTGQAVTNNSAQFAAGTFPIQSRFGLAPANASLGAANSATQIAFLQSLGTLLGTAGVKAVTDFNVTTTTGNYGWVAIPETLAVAGVAFWDESNLGAGGWTGANSAGSFFSDIANNYHVVFDGGGQQFRVYRQNTVHASPTGHLWDIR
jgi:hypothetical protein